MGTRKIVALRPARKEGSGDAWPWSKGKENVMPRIIQLTPRRRRPLHRSRPGWGPVAG